MKPNARRYSTATITPKLVKLIMAGIPTLSLALLPVTCCAPHCVSGERQTVVVIVTRHAQT